MKIFWGRLQAKSQREYVKRLYAVKHWELSAHLLGRMTERGINTGVIHTILDNGIPIEYNDDSGTDRIVLEVTDAKVRRAIVCDITTECIVSVFIRDNSIKGRDNRKYFGGS